jgi:hypothetical protein
MKQVTIEFTHAVQDSQEYGSDDEHMVSRLFFDVEVDGQRTPGLWVDVKQPVGADYERDPIEVGRPLGYKGPMNYNEFRAAAEDYYRQMVGSGARGIRLGPNVRNVRMQKNRFISRVRYTFQADDESSSAW